jgi:putative RNA 2'-phosphotransferase
MKDMDSKQLVQISKMIAKTLRHKPESLGLKLERGGWISVDTLLAAFARRGYSLSKSELEEVVAKNDKRRFAFDDSGGRIRASQGHSVQVDLGLEPLEPPETLFHGTTEANLSSILESGLQRMKRHHVHLSADTETAYRVGSRHGKAVILTVNSKAMSEAGFVFYRSENDVWLTEAVPAKFLKLPSS